MQIKEVLQKSTDFLKTKGIETGRLDAELLLANALGLKRIDLYLRHEQPLTETEVSKCREFIARRGKGEPVAYILKEKDFFNINLYVDNRVLVPRPETESLVEFALDFIKNSPNQKLKVADLGSGSGAIGLAIAKANADVQVTLVEKSEGAAEVSQLNIERLSFQERCTLIRSAVEDFKPENQFDLILGNPPYISEGDLNVQKSVHQFEPHSALYGGPSGLDVVHSWLNWASQYLSPHGEFIFEIGITQGQELVKYIEEKRLFINIEILKDLTSRPRFIRGVKVG